MWKASSGLQENRLKETALQQKAFLLERETAAFQPHPLPTRINTLESEFENVYMDLQPTPQDYQARKTAVNFVNGLVRDKLSVGDVKKRYGVCHARAFGSFTMDMFTPTSDLDISLNVEHGVDTFTREERIKVLKKLTKLLYGLQACGGLVSDIQPVLRAKVPVVKFTHCKTGIECDISAENGDGITKSEFLRIFSSIDPRFRKLCFLMKAWANVHGINSSKDHTLNSLSIILLVAFHLQTRVPAILPPFSALLKGVESSTASHAVSLVENQAHNYKDFGRKNKESIGQLFHSFLTQLLAVKDLWQQGLCASTYEGTWTSTSERGWIFVEDFTALSQNAARAVNVGGFDAIYGCFNEAFTQLKSFTLGAYEAQSLRSLLFDPPMKPSVNQKKRHFENPETKLVLDQRKQGYLTHHYTPEDERVLSNTASWITRGERPRHVPVDRGAVARREHLAWMTQPSTDRYPVHTANMGLLDEHLAKRIKLQQPVLGDRYLPGLAGPQAQLGEPAFLPYQRHRGTLLRGDFLRPNGNRSRLQGGGQGSYALLEASTGWDYGQPAGKQAQSQSAHSRKADEFRFGADGAANPTYTGTHWVLPAPLDNYPNVLYNESSKALHRDPYPSHVSLYGYGPKLYDRY